MADVSAAPDRPASMRLFVALEVPGRVVAQVQEAVAPLASSSAGSGLRWVRPQRWHLTLVFLGSVEPRRVDDLVARLGRASARSAPIGLRVEGGGRFRGNVLWAGVTGDLEALGRLATTTGAAARRAGIAVEDRPYRAHLTLARSSGATDLRPLVDALHGLRTDAWTAAELRLVRSHLGGGPGGSSRYEVVHSWPLGPPGTATGSWR